MKLLLVDLDGTLINLVAFKEAFFTQIEEKYKVPAKSVTELYNEVKLLEKWPNLLIKELNGSFNLPEQEVRDIFESCFSKIILIKPTIHYLSKFDGTKYIFSFGDTEFQTRKIAQFHLEAMVNGIIITLEKKLEYLRKLVHEKSLTLDGATYNDVTVLDDDTQLLDNIRAQFPWIKAVNVADTV